METNLLKPNKKSINIACELIKNGDVVGVPTDTVYGLAADANNPDAIKKIFEAKGRPQDNPLAVLVSNLDMLHRVVKNIPDSALKLMKKFWPGPLTIIMQKGDGVCSETCAGLDSLGVRMPSNKVVRKIIEMSNTPFACPSANLSGKPCQTNAQDVFSDMNERIPLIIDGGECKVGVESTVVSCLNETPVILRPGVITKEQMEKVLGTKVDVSKAITENEKTDEKTLSASPSIKYKHYSLNADVIILKGDLEEYKQYVNEHKEKNCFGLVFFGEEKKLDIPCISYGKQNRPKQQAKKLFTALRQLDEKGAKTVYVRCPKAEGVSLAVFYRLIRSAGFQLIDLDDKKSSN